MQSSLIVLILGALLTAAAAFWVLRAYRANGGKAAAPAFGACSAGALGALALYLAIGHPELPDAPFDARLEALRHRDPLTFTAEEALAVLSEAAKQHPTDARPHIFEGQVLLPRDPQAAAREFDAALRRDPRSVEAMMGLGRALVATGSGHVSPEALQLFQQASAATNDPAPWIYQAMAAMQSNHPADARRFWGEAYTRMSADDPRREMARRMSTGRAQ